MIITLVAADFSVFAKYEKEQASPSDALEIDSSEKEASPNDAMMEQTIDISSEDGLCDITISGILPADVTAEARSVDVSEREGFEELSVICAYDITLYSDGQEYEPENGSVSVTIKSSAIQQAEADGADLSVYHIDDEDIIKEAPITESEGDTLIFEADSFSVYAVVKLPGDSRYKKIADLDELAQCVDQKIYMGHIEGYYFKNTTYSPKDKRTGIEKTKPASPNFPHSAAVGYYMESAGQENQYYFYCYVNGSKKYIYNDPADSLELSDDKNAFKVIYNETNQCFNVQSLKNTSKYWNMQGDANGNGFCTYNLNGGGNFYFWTEEETEGDPLELDGKEYGIMNYHGGEIGNSMMSDFKSENILLSEKMTIMSNKDNANDKIYIPDGSDISTWKFSWLEDDEYTISTTIDGNEKYLSLSAQGISFSDTAVSLKIVSGQGSNSGMMQVISLSDGSILTYNGDSGFSTTSSSSDNNSWLSVVEQSELTRDYQGVSVADMVSVSDRNITNGSKVVLYTRIWNDNTKKYEFYAVDHDGSLKRCYESGDCILWLGDSVNTLLWDFTEYFYEGTTDPNYYYELYNEYSGKYIAPQIRGDQVLSDSKIGINLPGRKGEGFYSEIMAWDDPYYSYAGVKIVKESDGSRHIVSCPRAETDYFYFAVMEDTPSGDTMTEVKTLDNNEHGITMKMVDFGGETLKPAGSTTTKQQHDVMGNSDYVDAEATKGLLSSNLDPVTGYPTAVNTNKSLSELFGSAKVVNNLFIDSIYNGSGYYEFDSTQNFAKLQSDNTFKVYEELGTTDNGDKPSLKHGQFFPYDDITPGKFASKNGLNLYDAEKHELPDEDPRKNEQLYLVSNPNYYFGMEVEASFVQTTDGQDAWGHDIIYEFTGDDDFWLYVDGELIIDLGGIHGALPGKVNYCTGEVEVNGVKTTLYDIYKTNYETRYPDKTPAEVDEYLNGIFKLKDGKYVYKDYSTHTMKIFYMERGAGASNLHMRFNLASVKEGQVLLNKKISGTDQADYEYAEYAYQIFYKKKGDLDFTPLTDKDEHGDVTVEYQNSKAPVRFKSSYTPPGGHTVYNNVFFLNPGKPVLINVPDDTLQYYIVECGVNADIYNEVKVNDETLTGTSTQDDRRYDYSIAPAEIRERPNVIFDNHVDPGSLRNLKVTKELYDAEGNRLSIDEDDTTFTYRLSLGSETADDLSLANLQKYYVKDSQNNYCKWDYASQSFVSLEKYEFDSLTEDEKRAATFESSPNGSISKIPADYSIEVRNLLIGTKFKVEERLSDMPKGYGLKEYVRDGESYIIPDMNEVNSGIVRNNESPSMKVRNVRGWGLTVNKKWTDASFMDSHDPIYIGVFAGDNEELVPGTLRKLTHPTVSQYYFFDNLGQDAQGNKYTFADYKAREVTLTNPVVDADGNVTQYDDLEIMDAGVPFNHKGRTKGSSEDHSFAYIPSYSQGDPHGVTNPGNVREDDITNTRGGGVILRLKTWNDVPLQGGKFKLKKGDEVIGDAEYTSDKDGLITILYDFDKNVDYTLVETSPPTDYLGLIYPINFKIDENDKITVTHENGDGYTDVDYLEADVLIANIIIRNKQFLLSAVKVDDYTKDPLRGAHFALYKQVKGAGNTPVKAYDPMEGYEDLVSGDNGVIPKINNNLVPGTYYLVEKSPPDDYEGIDEDICFTISDLGVVTINNSKYSSFLTKDDSDPGKISYIITIPNKSEGTIPVTGIITDTNPYIVAGIMMLILIIITIYGSVKKGRYKRACRDTGQGPGDNRYCRGKPRGKPKVLYRRN